MSQISYDVTCRVPGESKALEWLTWLKDEHVKEVIKCGARKADIIRFDDDGKPGVLFQIRYFFDTRESLETYLEEHAPRLRDDGIKRFPPEQGFLYERHTGELLFTF
jgi:hypothetical protein